MNTLFLPNSILPRVANSQPTLIKLTQMFLDSYRNSLDSLRIPLENEDMEALQKNAHHMKPTVFILFPEEHHNTIKFLEKKSSLSNKQQTIEMFLQLKSDIKRFAEEAKNYLATH